MPLHDVKVGVWCAIGAARLLDVYFSGERMFTLMCYIHSDTIFFYHLSNYERTLSLFFSQTVEQIAQQIILCQCSECLLVTQQ